MNSATWYGLVGAVLCGIGLYGLIVHPHVLRKILSFNLLGAGVFLIAGVVARRGAAAGLPGDPVLQGLVITGIIVAFAATALAVALLLRFAEAARTASLAEGAVAPDAPQSPDPAPVAGEVDVAADEAKR
jgi:multicomponent Na+:H+ antiporter subunit C